MRIERLENSKRKQERVLVYLEDGSILRITGAELLQFGLYQGLDLPPETLAALEAAARRSDTKRRGANMAAGRMLSKKELTSRLTRKGASPEDAADITQEVFLRAWRSMKDFRGDSGFATWLFRITMNQCVDYARHKQSQPPTQPLVQGEDDEERELPLPDTAPSPEEHLENSELGRELAAALDEVSDEHRRIVLLRDVSGMSYTEIAEILEVSEGTVKSRLSRARIALRKILLKRGNLFHLPSSKDMEGGEEHE